MVTRTSFDDECGVSWGWSHIRDRGDASKGCLLERGRAQQRKFPIDWTKQFANLGWKSQVFVSCALVHSLYLMNE
jgi:hypothetical protein